jgi:hypothetical protein
MIEVLTLARSIETIDLVFGTDFSSLVLCPDEVFSSVTGFDAIVEEVAKESGRLG